MAVYILPNNSAPLTPFIGDEKNISQLIYFDAFIKEDHNMSSVIPTHPVSAKYPISDNIYQNQNTLTIEAVKSASSIYPDGGGNRGVAFTAYKKLKRLFEKGTLVSVRTGLAKYKNMAIKSISIPRDKSTTGVFRFTVELVALKIVTGVSFADDRLLNYENDYNATVVQESDDTFTLQRRNLLFPTGTGGSLNTTSGVRRDGVMSTSPSDGAYEAGQATNNRINLFKVPSGSLIY